MTDHASHVRAQLPLAGVVLCSTSVSHEERVRLAEIAIQMGATHKLDLTADVTHLVIGSVDTPKYRFVARERPDVRVLLPSWIDAVREEWMQGGETHVARLEEKHRAPALHGLRVCVTGFDDPVQRQQLVTTIEQHGAEYHGDLTREATHLIVAQPHGKKFDFARKWGMRTVAVEWLQDSINRGLALDHTFYDPLMPQEERGKGAFVEAESGAAAAAVVPTSKLAKRAAEELLESGMRKLRRTVSAKLGSQNGSIWADITAVSGDNRRRSDGQWEDLQVKQVERPAVPEKKDMPAPVSGLGRSMLGAPKAPSEAMGVLNAWVASRPREGIFRGRVVYLHGFDEAKSNILRQHLEPNGAVVLRTPVDFEPFSLDDLEHGFLVIPNDILLKDLPAIPEYAKRLLKVTNWWVEKCLYRKTLVDPLGDVTCRPFTTFRIDGFENMVMTSTGFTNVDLLHISKVVKLMGATYEEYLKPETSVVICHPGKASQAKLKYAYERSIPAVTGSWLFDSLEMGVKKNLSDYSIQSDRDSESSAATSTRQLSDEEKAKLMSRRKSAVTERQRQLKAIEDKAKLQQLKAMLASTGDSSQSQYDLSLPPPLSAATPLQEISANSPRRRPSDSSSKSTTGKSSSSRNPSSTIDPDPDPKAAAAALMEPPPSTHSIAALIQRPRTSEPTSITPLIGTDPEAPARLGQRRRRGLLGRASSWSSDPKAGTDVAAAAADAGLNLADADADAGPATEQEESQVLLQDESLMLSQNLSYDDPEAQKARELMMRRIGGKVEVERGRVESVGVVRDGKKVVVEEKPVPKAGRRLRSAVA